MTKCIKIHILQHFIRSSEVVLLLCCLFICRGSMALSRDFVKEEVHYDGDDRCEEVLEEKEDKSTQHRNERGGYCHICWLWLKDDSTRSMERHRRHSQRCRRWQEWQAGGRAQVKAPCGKCGQLVADSRDAMWQHQRTAKCARPALATSPTSSSARR